MAYRDRSIGVTEGALTIRGYYFPGTVRRVPLTAIRSVRRAATAGLRGRGRIWGTANPGYWANFDPGRSRMVKASDEMRSTAACRSHPPRITR